MNSAVDNYKNGYNCGESIFKSGNDKLSLNIPVSLGSAMGGGMAIGTMCGAVCAGSSVIGLLKGRNESSEKNEARAIGKAFITDFTEHFGSHICIDLKKKGVSCQDIVEYVENYVSTIK